MAPSITFDQGTVTARDPSDLRQGEMVSTTGGWYKPGDTTRLHKAGGRTAFGEVDAGERVNGVALCQFDEGGTDALLALVGASVYSAVPGLTGSPTLTAATGLDSSTDSMVTAHAFDRHYIALGYDRNYVLKPDGTFRRHGMVSPASQPVVTPAANTGTVDRPASGADAAFTNFNNARDSTDTNFAHVTRSTAGSSAQTWTITATAAATYVLKVQWQLAGYQQGTDPGGGSGGSVGTGGTTDAGFKVTVTIGWVLGGGASGSGTLVSRTNMTSAMGSASSEQVSLGALSIGNTVAVTVTLTYTSGTLPATLRHYFSKIDTGSPTGNFSTTAPMYYAVTEYDASDGIESPPGPLSDAIEFASPTTRNRASVTLPTAQNSNATHYRIYRTPEGGTAPGQLGRIGQTPITSTTFLDDFVKFPSTEQPPDIVPLVSMSVQNPDGTEGDPLLFPRDSPPPALSHISYFRGSLVGVSKQKPRSLYFSQAAMPDSFPEVNIIGNWNVPEREQLIATATVGNILVIGMTGSMHTLTDLPRVTDGQFNAAEAEPLRGQPGLVGVYALCAFSVAGESRAAWVSRYGVHETNGVNSRRISVDVDWSALVETGELESCVLHWDKNRQVLVFAFPSAGSTDNDRYALIHMSPEHEKQNGQPKWTFSHYGEIACLASGEIGGVHYLYSGHADDGYLYVEDNGGVDESESYSSEQVPMIVTSGNLYGDYSLWSIYRGNLRHSNFGVGETGTIDWLAHRDASDTDQTRSKTVALSSAQGTECFIGLAGEYHRMTFTHTGEGSGSIQDFRMVSAGMGKAGRTAA